MNKRRANEQITQQENEKNKQVSSKLLKIVKDVLLVMASFLDLPSVAQASKTCQQMRSYLSLNIKTTSPSLGLKQLRTAQLFFKVDVDSKERFHNASILTALLIDKAAKLEFLSIKCKPLGLRRFPDIKSSWFHLLIIPIVLKHLTLNCKTAKVIASMLVNQLSACAFHLETLDIFGLRCIMDEPVEYTVFPKLRSLKLSWINNPDGPPECPLFLLAPVLESLTFENEDGCAFNPLGLETFHDSPKIKGLTSIPKEFKKSSSIRHITLIHRVEEAIVDLRQCNKLESFVVREAFDSDELNVDRYLLPQDLQNLHMSRLVEDVVIWRTLTKLRVLELNTSMGENTSLPEFHEVAKSCPLLEQFVFCSGQSLCGNGVKGMTYETIRAWVLGLAKSSLLLSRLQIFVLCDGYEPQTQPGESEYNHSETSFCDCHSVFSKKNCIHLLKQRPHLQVTLLGCKVHWITHDHPNNPVGLFFDLVFMLNPLGIADHDYATKKITHARMATVFIPIQEYKGCFGFVQDTWIECLCKGTYVILNFDK